MFGKRGLIRGLNDKRGQNVTITTVILIILGLIVLVLLILVLVRGTGFIFLLFGLGESSQAAAELCKQYVALGGEGLYCQFTDEERRLDGKKQYFNCDHPDVNLIFKDEVDQGKIPNCGTEGFPSAKKFCIEESLRSKAIVNDKSCELHILGAAGGNIKCTDLCEGAGETCQWVPAGGCPAGKDVTNLIEDNTGKSDENSICCRISSN